MFPISSGLVDYFLILLHLFDDLKYIFGERLRGDWPLSGLSLKLRAEFSTLHTSPAVGAKHQRRLRGETPICSGFSLLTACHQSLIRAHHAQFSSDNRGRARELITDANVRLINQNKL